MVKHYNAFISYRHSEKDSKIAAEIQRQLERCHIPKAIKKQYGIKKIARIFRDKEELPITSNLNENIANALENSDYLIVICSTSTKESMWVPREIEYFLRNHTKKQVLTVLVDGEPLDVIPKMLLSEQVIKYDDLGNSFVTDEPIEPLSCDYRMPVKKARKEELPRLAATIIGCSYDELVRRQRQYKIKRVTSILSVALVLAGLAIAYLAWSTVRIQENYQESLRNQSRYLANESLNLLEDEQRIKAILLALEALPSEENPERPVTPEAEYALSTSVLAYTTLTGSNIASDWNYQCANTVSGYEISPSGATLTAYDKSNYVYIWDTSTKELLSRLAYNSYINDIKYVDDDSLIICSYEYFECINPKTGETLWLDTSETIPEEITSSDVYLHGDTFLAYSTTTNKLYEVSTADGKIVREHPIPLDADGNTITITDIIVCEDDSVNKIVISYHYPSYSDFSLMLYDLETDTYENYSEVLPYINATAYIDSDKLAIMCSVDPDGGYSSSSFYDMKVLNDSYMQIYLVDLSDMSLIWNNTLTYTQVYWGSELMEYNYIDQDNESHSSLLAYAGNIATVYSLDNGEILATYNLNTPIIYSCDNNDGTIQFVTNDGYMGASSNKTSYDSATLIKYFANGIDSIKFRKGAYIHKSSGSEIIHYSSYNYDDSITLMDDSGINNIADSYIGDKYLTIIHYVYNSSSECYLSIYDLETKTLAYEYDLGTEASYSQFKILEEDGDTIKFVSVNDTDDYSYHDLNLYTVNVAEQTLDYDKTTESPIRDIQYTVYNNGYLYMGYSDYGSTDYLAMINVAESTCDFIEFETYTGSFCDPPVVSNNANYVFCCTTGYYYLSEYGYYLVDIANRSDHYLFTSNSEFACGAFDDEEKYFACANENSIYMYSTDGTLLWELPTDGIVAYDMEIHNNELYIVVSGGLLRRYSVEDGTFLSQTDIMISSIHIDQKTDWYWDDENSLLFYTYKDVLSIIDTKNWIMTSYASNAIGYSPVYDIICSHTYTTDSNNNYVGYYKHYTVQDLIEKGNEIVQNATLSDEEKSLYGIK